MTSLADHDNGLCRSDACEWCLALLDQLRAQRIKEVMRKEGYDSVSNQ